MATNKGGRPPSDNPKNRPRQIKFTQDQEAYIIQEAQRSGLTFAEYVRVQLLPAELRTTP